MSVFRSPLYLDLETLVPLANYHDIEVMVDVAITQRDLGQRSGKGEVNLALPIPGSPGLSLGGSKGSESEVTQARTIKDHPTNALNRLLDELTKNNDIVTDLAGDEAVVRRQLVEIDGDWDISPATDAGALMTSVLGMVADNPALLRNKGAVPTRELTSLLTSPSERGRVVLETTLDDSPDTHILVLLDSRFMVGESSVDDLESDRTVFGQVDSIVPEGSSFSLDKFFLSGFPRSIRRAFSANDLIQAMSGFGYSTTKEDIEIEGPLFVVKAVAIY